MATRQEVEEHNAQLAAYQARMRAEHPAEWYIADDDILTVRPIVGPNPGALTYQVAIEGYKLGHVAICVTWAGQHISQPTQMPFVEVRKYVKPEHIRWLQESADSIHWVPSGIYQTPMKQ